MGEVLLGVGAPPEGWSPCVCGSTTWPHDCVWAGLKTTLLDSVGMADPIGPEYLRRVIQERRELPGPDTCRQLREACDIPIADLAASIGVTAAAVRQWERGERTPRGDVRRRYVEALRVLKESVPAPDGQRVRVA